MKKILINATQKEELRVAITDGKKLIDLDIDTLSSERKKGNIYKGTIARVEPGLDAVFVDYGDPKHGFLPFREISYDCLEGSPSEEQRNPSSIAKSLRHGQSLLVQVQREGRDNKGAVLTTYISLAGRYLVLLPNSPRGGGVSRRVGDKDRGAMRQIISQLETEDSKAGIIARTQGVGRDREALQRDFDCLKKLWDSIIEATNNRTPPFLVYQESNIAICALRDHFSDDIEKILIDDEEIFRDARDFIQMVMPDQAEKLNLYQEPIPLFDRFEIEDQIEAAFHRKVSLPSGGSLILDRTEALLSIDINSGKSTKAGNIEETALNTNLEAVQEIALQLRLRDLGGLIVIDFIDMESIANRRAVEKQLYKATRADQARIQFERISRFGLLEMSRQRMRPSLSESNHMQCSHCDGKGVVRTLESSSLAALRMIEKEAIRKNGDCVIAHLPIETASFLLNEKRENITEIEVRHGMKLVIIPDAHIQEPNVQPQKYRDGTSQSYKSSVDHKPTMQQHYLQNNSRQLEKSALSFTRQAKKSNGKTGTSLLSRILALFKPGTAKEKSPDARRSRRRGGRKRQRRYRSNGNDRSGQKNTPSSRRSDHQPAASQASGSQDANRESGRSQRRTRQAQSQRRRPSPQDRERPDRSRQAPRKPASTANQKTSQPYRSADEPTSRPSIPETPREVADMRKSDTPLAPRENPAPVPQATVPQATPAASTPGNTFGIAPDNAGDRARDTADEANLRQDTHSSSNTPKASRKNQVTSSPES